MQILKRQANTTVVLLFLGVIAGALVGYETRPAETSEIRLGPLNIEVQGKKPSVHDELTNDQLDHIVTVTLIGGVIGLAFGFAIQRGLKF